MVAATWPNGTSRRFSSKNVAISVLPSAAKTRVAWGALASVNSVGSSSKDWAPAFAASPEAATSGNTAAATITPANPPTSASVLRFRTRPCRSVLI